MKILLIGEYSNVHWTLAEGLRKLGHSVTVVSDGDGWKNYPRDISLKRNLSWGRIGALLYGLRLLTLLPRLKGYDVVQFINPVFFSLKAEKLIPVYRKIARNNKRIFLGAFGMDRYYVKACVDTDIFKYSDFKLDGRLRQSQDNTVWYRDWYEGDKGRLNDLIANDCNGIVSGLYEYDAAYRPYFAGKLTYIPFPINTDKIAAHEIQKVDNVRFFIGIQKLRSQYKGTDIMLCALERVKREFPDLCTIVKVESVPYAEYQRLLDSCHVMLDQLYSYTPAMNALLGMAKGLVIVGGGEPENYEILGEDALRPIVNVEPNEQSVYEALKDLVVHKEKIPELSRQSVEYIRKHHNYVKVAQRYLDFWTKQTTQK